MNGFVILALQIRCTPVARIRNGMLVHVERRSITLGIQTSEQHPETFVASIRFCMGLCAKCGLICTHLRNFQASGLKDLDRHELTD